MQTLIEKFEQKDVFISLNENGKLLIDAPQNILSDGDFIFLKENKKSIITELKIMMQNQQLETADSAVFGGNNELGNKFIDYIIRYVETTDLRKFQLNAPTVKAYESECELIQAISENESSEKLNQISKKFIKSHTHSLEFHDRTNWVENKLNTLTLTINSNNKIFNGMICTDIQSHIINAVIQRMGK